MKKQSSEIATITKETPLQAMAARLSVDPDEMKNIIMQTVMPQKGKNVTQEQFVAFLIVANTYGLDPIKKEIYAFPNNGAIQAIVSIDGWLLIINSHKQYNGMELLENLDTNGKIISVTCTMHRKDHAHPTVVTEYLSECDMQTSPWKKKPIRMLRHKATIQCARYAFGLSGIMDEDDGYALEEKEINPAKPESALRRPAADQEAEAGETIDQAADTEPEAVKLIPVGEILISMATCEDIEALELIVIEAKKYPNGSDDSIHMGKEYRISKARILLAEDAAKLKEKEADQ